MRNVILESPYAGASKNWIIRYFQKWRNVRYARKCVHHSLSMGESCLASHLLYPQVLNDKITVERNWGIEAGLSWLQRADASVVYLDRGLSDGMRKGIECAARAGLPVIYRHIEKKVPASWAGTSSDAATIRPRSSESPSSQGLSAS